MMTVKSHVLLSQIFQLIRVGESEGIDMLAAVTHDVYRIAWP
jgi:hypothetical protein